MVCENTKGTKTVIICGARCIFKKDGKCNWEGPEGVAAVIGIDGKCIKFETSEEK